jgi:hypothetical protein
MDWFQGLDDMDLHAEVPASFLVEDRTSTMIQRADSLDLEPSAAVMNNDAHQAPPLTESPTTLLSTK